MRRQGCAARLVSEALRPAETTDEWAGSRAGFGGAEIDAALAGVTLVEAPRERDEAAAIAVALRQAVEETGGKAALVTGDRELARRVSAELLRFGVRADDSGGTPLANTPPAALLRLMLEAVFRPGDPVAVRRAAEAPAAGARAGAGACAPCGGDDRAGGAARRHRPARHRDARRPVR